MKYKTITHYEERVRVENNIPSGIQDVRGYCDTLGIKYSHPYTSMSSAQEQDTKVDESLERAEVKEILQQ